MSSADDLFANVWPTLDRLREEARPRRMLRITRPPRTIAFSRRDERQPGFERAVAVARDYGFAAAVRPVGGTFAPLHEGSLVVDEFGWSPSGEWPNERFDRHAALLAEVFVSFGIDARLGEVAGEYCPGAHSVNRAGQVKISGTAQRVSRGSWLVSSVVQVGPIEALREVTARVAEALDQEVDAAIIGALTETVPDLTIAEVATRIAERFAADGVDGVEDGVAEIG